MCSLKLRWTISTDTLGCGCMSKILVDVLHCMKGFCVCYRNSMLCTQRHVIRYLVQNVDGRGLEQEHGQDEGERQEGTLPAGQLRQRLLPDIPEGHAHLQS